MDEQTIKDAARLSAAARAKKLAPHLCPRCGKPTTPPYTHHWKCQQLDVAERRERILNLPEKPMTEEIWRRMWEPEP